MATKTTHKDLVAAKSPPSTYEIAALLDGEPGAFTRVVSLTLQRALFIGSGMALADIRGRQLVWGAVYASVAVTAWIAALYAFEARKEG